MKKIAAVIAAAALASIMCIGMCACSQQEQTGGEESTNPMKEATVDEITSEVGITVQAPENATNVEYFIYETEDPIAEVRFDLEGAHFNFRAAKTSETAFAMTGAEALKAIQESPDSYTNALDISGVYDTWTSVTDCTFKNLPAQFYSNDTSGVYLVLNAVPGIVYSLSSTDTNAFDSFDAVMTSCYVPMQDNA